MKPKTDIYDQDEMETPAPEKASETTDPLLQLAGVRQRNLVLRRIGIAVVIVYALGCCGWVLYRLGKARGSRLAAARPAVSSAAAQIDSVAADIEQGSVEQLRHAIAGWRTAPDKVRQAQDLRQRGHMDYAQQALEQLLQENPNNLDVQLALSRIYIDKAKFRQAEDLLQRVLNIDPVNEPARLGLAMAYSQSAQHDLALALAQWILESKPQSVDAHRIAAAAYRQQGRTDQELVHWRRWAALEPTNAAAAFQVAEALMRLPADSQAQPLLEEYTQKYPEDAEAFRLLAVCYARQTQTGKAVETLTRALALFGRAPVAGWLQDKGFDGIRQQKLFVTLLQQFNRPAFVSQPGRREERLDLGTLFDAKKASQLQDMLKKDR